MARFSIRDMLPNSRSRRSSAAQHSMESEEMDKIFKEYSQKLKMQRQPIKVYVRILTGRKFALTLDIEDKLEDVKEKIRLKEGIHPDQQELLFNGINWMNLDETVRDKFIRSDDILFLVLRNRGG